MFLNNNWILLEFLKTKVYVRQVFVDGILFFPDIMSDRLWKIICNPGDFVGNSLSRWATILPSLVVIGTLVVEI